MVHICITTLQNTLAFFVLKHRKRSMPGLFPFLQELTLQRCISGCAQRSARAAPFPLHHSTGCASAQDRGFSRPRRARGLRGGAGECPAEPSPAGPREERVGKSSHSHAMAPPAARIPGTAQAAGAAGTRSAGPGPGCSEPPSQPLQQARLVPGPAGLFRTALTPPSPSPAGAGTRVLSGEGQG